MGNDPFATHVLTKNYSSVVTSSIRSRSVWMGTVGRSASDAGLGNSCPQGMVAWLPISCKWRASLYFISRQYFLLPSIVFCCQWVIDVLRVKKCAVGGVQALTLKK